ncbi:hypothetical protein ACLOAU_11035 [Niabella sp. CJ426]|uniref:hypothetical protein n=1 Tax=Niabella sp. CJ426 TaxID=3393740 RepID=UPI003D09077F
MKSDTVYYSGQYKVVYTNRCKAENLEKIFVFQDIRDVGKPAPYYPSTITLGNSNNNELTIAAAQCMVDMDGYRFYKKNTE